VHESNKGANALAEGPLSSSSSKHVDVRCHFVRELVSNGDITVDHTAGKEQCADILTTALDRTSFEMHRGFLLGSRKLCNV
ncbi:unnamed protein product, partial [Sphacelaria rigidula]